MRSSIPSKNKTVVGKRRSTDQVHTVYWLCIPVFVLLEKLTGHNPIVDTSFVKTIEELGKTFTTKTSQKNAGRNS